MRTLSAAAIAAINGDNTDEVFIVLLKIEHDDLAAPLRVANNNEDVVRTETTSVTYLAAPFDIELPSDTGEEPGVATISVPNVDRVLVDAVRAIASPPVCSLLVVLASSPNTVEVEFSGLTLREVFWDQQFITGQLRFESIIIEPITITITPARFPGLF